MKQFIEYLGEFEILSDEAATELSHAGLPYEYERGVLRFWVDGERREIYPARWQPYVFSYHPVYDIEEIRMTIASHQGMS